MILRTSISLFIFVYILSVVSKPQFDQKEIFLDLTRSNSSQLSLVKFAKSGKLIYKLFANEGEVEELNKLPDFSYAGYKGGGVALPRVSECLILNPVKGDNTRQIQNAIDKVSNMPIDSGGLRGKILLKSGVYNINGSLFIKASGVILAGEGQGINGTILNATKRERHTLIVLGDESSRLSKIKATASQIVSSYVPTGARTFNVESTNGYNIGDTIYIQKTPNSEWIHTLDMEQYGWVPSSYNISHERIITGITDNEVSVNIPLVDPIKLDMGGGQIYKVSGKRKTQNSGIEHLRLVSEFDYDEDEEHAWDGISLQMAENCWVKNVTAQYFGNSCVTIDQKSAFNTVEDCAMLDPKSITKGKRKYSFYIVSGSFNLFQRCYTKGGRHDFVTGSRVTGPNVFLDCYATETHSDIGPHHRWATGTLFDNVKGGAINVRNREDSGTGHGWAGSQTMFWNCISTSKKGITVENPPGSINWIIGGNASKLSGNGYQELFGKQVLPRSIYLAQLEERLGKAAIVNTTTAPQRKAEVYRIIEVLLSDQ